MSLEFYNSLTRKKEVFKPIKPNRVGMYNCGPTVYSYTQIGNWRTYLLGDLVFRTLEYLGYQVDYVMNLTDVGHLTGDNLGDADSGEDRLQKAALEERRTAWEIARFYTEDFLKGFEQFNLKKPKIFSKATGHIEDQIKLIKRIEKNGFTYQIGDGIYFDTKAYEKAGNVYGQMSTLDRIKEGTRVAKNPEKRDPRDFALWKFSPKDKKRDMEWQSPWGLGFPGWHIECSAMSIKYLGEQFDLHLGGEDLMSTHHPNEIAQSEAATGKKPFVRFWLHGAFILVDGGRMGKSMGNAYTFNDLKDKGFSPLDLRYFYLTGHYHKQIDFTWEALKSARESRLKLLNLIANLKTKSNKLSPKVEPQKAKHWRDKFIKAVEDDLNFPETLAVFWKVLHSRTLTEAEKWFLVIDFDRVLGLSFKDSLLKKSSAIPASVKKLIVERDRLRKERQWQEADQIRKRIEELGFELKDSSRKTLVVHKSYS